MASSLFAYGSLCFPPVWTRVVGRTPAGEEARLPGFLACRMTGLSYPGLVEAAADAATPGLLYRDLTPPDWRALDLFEGEAYERIDVRVHLRGGRREPAQVYRLRAEFHNMLSEELWSADRFRQEALPEFLRDHGGFDRA